MSSTLSPYRVSLLYKGADTDFCWALDAEYKCCPESTESNPKLYLYTSNCVKNIVQQDAKMIPFTSSVGS